MHSRVAKQFCSIWIDGAGTLPPFASSISKACARQSLSISPLIRQRTAFQVMSGSMLYAKPVRREQTGKPTIAPKWQPDLQLLYRSHSRLIDFVDEICHVSMAIAIHVWRPEQLSRPMLSVHPFVQRCRSIRCLSEGFYGTFDQVPTQSILTR